MRVCVRTCLRSNLYTNSALEHVLNWKIETAVESERERTNRINILILVSVYPLFKRTNLHAIFLFLSVFPSLSHTHRHTLSRSRYTRFFDVVVLFSLFFVAGRMLRHVEIATTTRTAEKRTPWFDGLSWQIKHFLNSKLRSIPTYTLWSIHMAILEVISHNK